MGDSDKTKEQLINELVEMRGRMTGLKASETERKQAEEALKDSELELSTTLDNVPIIMLLVDRERRVQKLNQAAVQFAKRPAEEMIGLYGGDALRCLHSFDDPRGCGFGPDCQTCVERLTVLDTFETGNSHHQVEASLPFLCGEKQEELTFLVSTVLLTFSKGAMVLVCIEDITERKRMEKRVRQEQEFTLGLVKGLAVRNVARVIKPPRVARVTMKTLSQEEVTSFLDAARETDYYVYFATLIYTGLRRGELLALRWRNLDLDDGTLTVVETAYRLGNGEYMIKEPKTAQSRRSVILPISLVELFKVYRVDQELLRIQLGISLNADDFVFIRPDGSPIYPNAITLAFRRIIKRVGLKDIRIHDLRHTHATLLLKAGVHPKVVSERLGHASIGITLDIYSHVLPGLQEEAADKFDSIFEVDNDNNKNSDPNVSIMLAKSDELASRPYRSRTCDTLIKSQGVLV